MGVKGGGGGGGLAATTFVPLSNSTERENNGGMFATSVCQLDVGFVSGDGVRVTARLR